MRDSMRLIAGMNSLAAATGGRTTASRNTTEHCLDVVGSNPTGPTMQQ